MAQPGGTVGQRIVKARLLAGAARGQTMTQTELAKLVGVTSGTVSQWEAGAAIPPLPTIERIATTLGVTPGWIAFGEETKTPISFEIGGQVFNADPTIDHKFTEADHAADEAKHQARLTEQARQATKKRQGGA